MDLSRAVTILDGGMGKHLERAGAPFRQPEWSALALIEDPQFVLDGHRAFIASGADVITVNSYAVAPFHLGEDRFNEQGSELAGLAAKLARQAADESERDIRVGGSLPPLFGSYEPEKFDPARAPAMYRLLVEAQAPFVDLWIGETISLIAEAEAIAHAVELGPGPDELWLSFTVPEESSVSPIPIRSGESIRDAVDVVASRCEAILFNCSPPEQITAALHELQRALTGSHTGVLSGAFANAFEPKPTVYSANSALLGRRDELDPATYRSIARSWVDSGASIVGGCCHIHTEHITALAAEFTD